MQLGKHHLKLKIRPKNYKKHLIGTFEMYKH